MQTAPNFAYSARDIEETYGKSLKKLEDGVKKIISVPDKERNFENTIRAFDNATSDFADTLTIPIFLAYVSSDKDIREAAYKTEAAMSQYMVDLFTREDVFDALNAYAGMGDKPGEVEQKLTDKTLLDFKNTGLGLPEEQKKEVKKLMKELIRKQLDFSKNLLAVKDYLAVTEAELKGLPESYKQHLKKTEDGKYKVTMDYPDYLPFMSNAEDGEARRKLESIYNNRCAEENTRLMEDALELRKKIAHILGYKSHADYVLADRMAKNSETVFKFLGGICDKLKDKAGKELDIRLKMKNNGEKVLHAWETAYYNNKLRKEKYAIDHEKIKEYFPLETVINGMFDVFGSLLGARFVPAKLPVWHKDVRAYEVKNDDGTTAAYFYFDLFPRDNKYKHAACFGIRAGRELLDGTYQTPAAAIVANFPAPNAGEPSLLKFDDVETLFHEFGHVTHNIFTRARYGRFSGTSVSRDFVEVPSQILENWAYVPEVLKKVSGHYKDPSKKLPDETIKKLQAAKNMDAGLFYLRQLFFGILDMTYHTSEEKLDTTAVYAKLMKEIALIPMSEGVHPQASFGHLMSGYDAGYYGYMWSKVICMDLFSRFEKEGVMNRETGRSYRELILAPGRSYDEMEQVRKFLGRESNDRAFLKSIDAA